MSDLESLEEYYLEGIFDVSALFQPISSGVSAIVVGFLFIFRSCGGVLAGS